MDSQMGCYLFTKNYTAMKKHFHHRCEDVHEQNASLISFHKADGIQWVSPLWLRLKGVALYVIVV